MKVSEQSQCGSQGTWLLPSCGPALSRARGRERMHKASRVPECLILEVTHIISTHIPVPVLYWCITNHPKLSGLQQWQGSFCPWTGNLDRAQCGLLVSAPFGVSWDGLKAEGWSSWPTQPPLSKASICGYVNCGCSQNIYTWTCLAAAGLPQNLVPAFPGWVSQDDWTEAVLPFMTWLPKPHESTQMEGWGHKPHHLIRECSITL